MTGEALDDDDAIAILAEWNATCVPRWSDPELRVKLEGARNYGVENEKSRALTSDSSTLAPPSANAIRGEARCLSRDYRYRWKSLSPMLVPRPITYPSWMFRYPNGSRYRAL
jgi:hypothetical protein